MKPGFVINPIEEMVKDIKYRVKDNGGYCLYAEKGNKKNKCDKCCRDWDDCPCGMYIKDDTQ